ncbi:MAG: hypothetical protein PHY43_03920 [Verrucomicrobiales bacterium]|nr:hypothetical protein [Verrucomicrobiales bacterium]
MYKIRQPSSPVVNVVAGQVATHELVRGPRYHDVTYNVTVTKTGATAGNAFVPTLADALDNIVVLVNDSERRVHLATELDAIQTRWQASLAVAANHQIGNDLMTAVPDVVVGGNTTRTTTFVLTVNFAEPSRILNADREKFAWPTAWASGRTAKIQIKLKVPVVAGVVNPVITAQESIDFVLGPVVNGKDSLPMTAWVRQPEIYAGLNPAIRKWSFTGLIQQMTIFCQPNDDVLKAVIKNGNAIIFDETKIGFDLLCDRHNWNAAGKNADRCDIAADYTDNPGDVLQVQDGVLFELKLQLSAAAAANKTLVILSQVYLDALA